jgi:hypothetical protein
MKHIVLAAGLAAIAGVAHASDLIIENESLWDIHHIYLSDADSDEWGPDQLDDDVLEIGQTLRLKGVQCGRYDVKLVDEDGDVCELRNVKLCGDERWTIDDDALLTCQRNTD